MIIADTVVVWRCYVVWQADPRVIALLGFLLFGTIGVYLPLARIILMCTHSKPSRTATGASALAQHFLPLSVYAKEAVDVGYALYAVSLATNVITSLCTVGRVW